MEALALAEEPAHDEAPPAAQPPAPELALPSAEPEINFGNRLAVRVALVAAALSFLLTIAAGAVSIALMQIFVPLLISAAGGFYAVFLYRRRSGASMSVRNGARMGWITGVFGFVITTVLSTLLMIGLLSQGGIAALYRKNAAELGLPADTVDKMVEMLNNPAVLVLLLVFFLAFQFMSQTVASSVGGALGAKFLERDAGR